jgi:hypothetical protein
MATWKNSEFTPVRIDGSLIKDAQTFGGADELLGLAAGVDTRFPRSDFDAIYAPFAHRARHEDGGADEVSLAALSGLLADLQAHGVYLAGSLVGTRPTINFIAGQNVVLTIADNAGTGRVDVTVTVSGDE